MAEPQREGTHAELGYDFDLNAVGARLDQLAEQFKGRPHTKAIFEPAKRTLGAMEDLRAMGWTDEQIETFANVQNPLALTAMDESGLAKLDDESLAQQADAAEAAVGRETPPAP